MADNDFLGTGLKFPISINPATGRASTSSGSQSVKESIYLILQTSLEERIARPWFGSNLDYYAFMDVNYTNLNMMVREITDLILKQEPRIDSVDVTPESDLDNGRLIIKIDYWLANQHNPDSLVFPFYLNVQEETKEPEVSFDEAGNVVNEEE